MGGCDAGNMGTGSIANRFDNGAVIEEEHCGNHR